MKKPRKINKCEEVIKSTNKDPLYFLEISLRDLPELWFSVIHSAVNDYLQYPDHDPRNKHACKWLFFEDFDPSLLDSKGNYADIMSLYLISQFFGFNVGMLRFEVERLKSIADIDELGTKCKLNREECYDLMERCQSRAAENLIPEEHNDFVKLVRSSIEL